jgi:ribosome maturation factor RimP
MPQQDTENLFRRFKGKLVNIRSVSGEAYKGHVSEITNDYVLLIDRETEAGTQTFVLFKAIESVVVTEVKS